MAPDFPKIGGATAAEVWTYATRNLNSDANNTIRDAILSDATKFAGGNIDAAISSRSSHSAADVWAVAARTLTAFTGQPRTDLVGSNAALWSHATRELTGITGTPRSDLLGEDATFEAGTGTRKARIDDIPAFETQVETSIVMDGTEQTLVEKTDSKMGLLDGYVDLTPMGASDTIVIREYMKVKAAGNYIKYAEETYTGAQTLPLVHIVTKTAKTSIKVTAEQTAKNGGYKTLDVQFFRRLEA